MKKIMLKLSIIPVLLLAGFIALQSFSEKESIDNRLDPPVWFTFSGNDETDENQYTIAPGFDPGTSGCGGDEEMCAVLAPNNGSDKPVLDISGSSVYDGPNIEAILRHP